MPRSRSEQTLGERLAGPFARFFADGDGPTHDAIGSAFLSAGLTEDVEGPKERRVRVRLSAASEQEAVDLASELVDLLREGRFLESDHYQDRVQKLGAVLERVGATLSADGYLAWESGAEEDSRLTTPDLRVSPSADEEFKVPNPTIFLVHGHDVDTRDKIEMQLRRWSGNFNVVVLDQQASKGMTLIEKFEEYAESAAFAIVVATPDDEGRAVGAPELQLRARQNVVFEMGYFFGKLERQRVVVMNEGVEKPGDIDGIVWIDSKMSNWRQRLARELAAAGIEGNWLK